MKKCTIIIDDVTPFKDLKGRGIRWILEGETALRGLITVKYHEEGSDVHEEIVTYKQEASCRPIGAQSQGKQALQFAWDFFHGQELIVKPTKKGGIYSKGRRQKNGRIIGSTYEWWTEDGKTLLRSNRPDVSGSKRDFFEQEEFCYYDSKRDCLVIRNLPEEMKKGSGWVYVTEGSANELSEARRHGMLNKA